MATTYYRDHVVHISSEGVRVDDAWYPLDTLTYIWHRRSGRLVQGAYMLATRGGDSMINSTTDSPKFGQIYRALQRAVEQSA